MLVSVTAVN